MYAAFSGLFYFCTRLVIFVNYKLGMAVGGALLAYDSHYYGRRVLAPLNIIFYNVFTEHGANLYGKYT
jgi:hypothetical protein